MKKPKTTETTKEDLRGGMRLALATVKNADMLSTGSTLLNLALTNKFFGGFAKGKYFWVVGDSSSGKTFFCLTCLAEASINKNFANYDFYYDNNEDGALMDIAKYFGEAAAQRMRAPAKDDEGNPTCSRTDREFYYNLDNASKRAVARNRPFIYILDSENGLSSESEIEKFEEQKAAHEKGKESAGSYGDGKAKTHSTNLRRAVADLKKTGSILIVLSQTRDNLGFGFETKKASGGRALKFYATAEIWTSVKEKIKKKVKGKDRTIGILSEVRIKKNRFTGKDRTVFIPIYHSFGFDDVGANIDYLIEEKHWKRSEGDDEGTNYLAKEFKVTGSRDSLVAYVEENNLETELQGIVAEVWQTIEAACVVPRKPRYGQGRAAEAPEQETEADA
jgi:RecA/RadA recombinase